MTMKTAVDELIKMQLIDGLVNEEHKNTLLNSLVNMEESTTTIDTIVTVIQQIEVYKYTKNIIKKELLVAALESKAVSPTMLCG